MGYLEDTFVLTHMLSNLMNMPHGYFTQCIRLMLMDLIEYRFSGAWSILAEPGYIRKGGVVDDEKYFSGRFNLQLNYVQLPILANLYCTNRFFISFGPEFAYLISKGRNSIPLPDTFSPIEDNSFELSGLIGVNYSITKNIDLGLRYNHSLTHFSVRTWINPRYPPGYGIMGYSNVYNQYLQFIVRFKIKHGANTTIIAH